MDIQTVYIYLQFFIKLFCAEALFFGILKKRKYFVVWLLIGIVLGVAASLLFPLSTNIGLTIARYATLFGLTILVVWACADISFSNAVFYATGAYTIQHAAYNIHLVFTYSIDPGGRIEYFSPLYFAVLLPVYAAVYAAAFFIFIRKLKYSDKLYIKRYLLTAMLFLLTAISVVLSSFCAEIIRQSAISIKLICHIYASLVCILFLIIQFGLFERGNLSHENEKIKYMLRLKEDQKAIAQQSIDIINYKCHDLKHQLQLIKDSGAAGSAANFEETERAILQFEAQTDTGNNIIDIALTEKKLLCEQNKITMDCLLDGSGMTFVDDVDLYTIFCNAIDNAIEAVKNESDDDKRYISVSLKKLNDIYYLYVQNFCGKNIEFRDGLPVSTKKDSSFHGYGLKSIRYIARKYGGDINIKFEDNIFELCIMLPANKNAK